ncbi:pentapeptide repeat-containing protein [Streptomyces silvensis]|nr:pentapeptide repeat-containing protein [Streptomyces silvensis]
MRRLPADARALAALQAWADGTDTYLDAVGLDLSLADLSGAYFGMGLLYQTDLRRTNLAGASLCGVDARGADLGGACLDGAALVDIRLQGADLTDASVRETSFEGLLFAYSVRRYGSCGEGGRCRVNFREPRFRSHSSGQ